jgi:hypothetical protein
LSRRCASRGALCADSNFLKCTGICTKHCDRRHGAGFPDERHSICQHGSGARKKALFEPGDTRRQWKGEAAACFVHTGIASSRTLPTSSVGYWSPLLSLCNASASEEKRSFGGDFFVDSYLLFRCIPPTRPRNRFTHLRTATLSCKSHSHITSELQPCRAKASRFFLSRALFFRSFGNQKSRLDLGMSPDLHA